MKSISRILAILFIPVAGSEQQICKENTPEK